MGFRYPLLKRALVSDTVGMLYSAHAHTTAPSQSAEGSVRVCAQSQATAVALDNEWPGNLRTQQNGKENQEFARSSL
jgi:hypothetical protein